MCVSLKGVTSDMEYDERLARFRQGHVNPFDRSESDGTSDRKDPLKQGESVQRAQGECDCCSPA